MTTQSTGDRLGELRQQHYNAAVVSRRPVHDELLILRLRRDRPLPPFKAGQYTALGLGEWEAGPTDTGHPADTDGLLRGYFSISSPIVTPDGALIETAAEDSLEFYIAQDGAPLSTRLFALRAGDRLWMAEATAGSYTLDGIGSRDDVLLMATGTGEAPHNRMIWELLRHGHDGRIASVVCCRRRGDLAYRELHEQLARRHASYRYLPLTSRDRPGPRRHIQDLLLDGTLSARTGIALEPATTRIFLCGNSAMIGRPHDEDGRTVYPEPPGVIEILETRFGFRADRPGRPGNIHFERY